MPKLSKDELRKAISDGTIKAISLDTNIFHKLGYDLNIPTVRKLDQFKDTNVSVVFSEVVVREMQKHISDKAEETANNLASSLKKYQKRWDSQFDLSQISATLGLGSDPSETASHQISNFMDDIGAEIVPVKGNIDIDILLKSYFDIDPPFENNAKKKAEFPDAMALLSIEASLTGHSGYVIVVSDDNGWQQFAERSEKIICIQSIEEALDHFNDAGRFIADQTVNSIRNGELKDLCQDIDTTIQARLDDNDFLIEADSHLSLEWESEYASLQHWEIADYSSPRIIASDDNTVTFAIDLTCIVDFAADFHFSIYDSVDKDHVSMGSEHVSRENTVQLTAVMTISRDSDPEPELIESSITTQRINVDFGYIEPDWGYEE